MLRTAPATAALSDLIASGAPAFVLAHKATRSLDNLREAYAALGADRLAAALGTMSGRALRVVLIHLDPYRTGISRLPRVEVDFLLSEIAAGGPLCPADDAEPALPLTRASLDRAASARGSVSMDLSDSWVAGFLGTTAA